MVLAPLLWLVRIFSVRPGVLDHSRQCGARQIESGNGNCLVGVLRPSVSDREPKYNPQRLRVALETVRNARATDEAIQLFLCNVPERRMPEIVRQPGRFSCVRIDSAESISLGGVL